MQEDNENAGQSNIDDGLAEVIRAINQYHQEVTITAVAGDCPYGHRKEERFIVTTMNSDGLCGSLYQAIHPFIAALEYGGGAIWGKSEGRIRASCPEGGKVQVEINRKENENPMKRLKTPDKFKDMTGKGFSRLDEYKVVMEVIGIEKNCMWGHKVGDKHEIDPFNVGGICGYLFWEIYSFVNLLYTGGGMPWEGDNDIIHGTCPDPYDLLSYRLIREKR
ncbi:MAG: TIGR04076 family protein [Deltaproteobacteria bacterium]|jgi:uncharacterized repeat protein (TIGR04076 family)|nr:TIGR04076 family protein [Deltaproteobacteria bacterium]